MNREQAAALIRGTFIRAFDKPRFHNFTLNLLNKFDESKAVHWNTTYIKDASSPMSPLRAPWYLNSSPDDDKLDVLVVHLTNEAKLERARTAIRNFVADHLKQRDEKDAALVAFVSPTERQWRFYT